MFARKANVSPPTIYNVIKGKDIFLSIALRIEKATRHKVRCKDLLSESLLLKKRKRVLPYRPRPLKEAHSDEKTGNE
jgi:AcrR family transcriptional regulator